MAGIPNLLIERPERDGSKTKFIFTHKGDSVDFKMQPCKQLEDGEWEMIESFEDPETTGYMKVTDEGELWLFATAPRKWCLKFKKGEEEGTWVCHNDRGQTAKPSGDIKPRPSLLGAGGLPKGAVNVGEIDDEFSPLW